MCSQSAMSLEWAIPASLRTRVWEDLTFLRATECCESRLSMSIENHWLRVLLSVSGCHMDGPPRV